MYIGTEKSMKITEIYINPNLDTIAETDFILIDPIYNFDEKLFNKSKKNIQAKFNDINEFNVRLTDIVNYVGDLSNGYEWFDDKLEYFEDTIKELSNKVQGMADLNYFFEKLL